MSNFFGELLSPGFCSLVGRLVQAIRHKRWYHLYQKPKTDNDAYSLVGAEFLVKSTAAFLLIVFGLMLCIVIYAVGKWGIVK